MAIKSTRSKKKRKTKMMSFPTHSNCVPTCNSISKVKLHFKNHRAKVKRLSSGVPYYLLLNAWCVGWPNYQIIAAHSNPAFPIVRSSRFIFCSWHNWRPVTRLFRTFQSSIQIDNPFGCYHHYLCERGRPRKRRTNFNRPLVHNSFANVINDGHLFECYSLLVGHRLTKFRNTHQND